MRINYNLSLLQFAASRFLLSSYLQSQNAIIIAVCGAGKTEMCFPLIAFALKRQMKLAFAIPRTAIVHELYERIKDSFGKLNCGVKTGARKVNLNAPILCLTTNQLVHYTSYFDIIIIDEVDAYPFATDERYWQAMRCALKSDGNCYLLTATCDQRITDLKWPLFTVYKRWHNQPLPLPHFIPRLTNANNYLPLSIHLLYQIRKRKLLIFVANVARAKLVSTHLRRYRYRLIHANAENKEDAIANFANDQLQVLLTTTILERGVTFSFCDIIVIDSDDSFYTCASLIQIAGRANRKLCDQNAIICFYYSNLTKTLISARKQLIAFNKQI